MKPFAIRLVPFLLAPLLTAFLLYLPDASLQRMRGGWEGVVLTDRGGHILYSIPTGSGGYQHRLSRDQIPAAVRETFLRLEDRRFYRHGGVDFLAAARALALNIGARRIVSGASTVTMQLSRMLYPHPGGITGKTVEMLRALSLEARLSKRQILHLYLNNLPFGYNTLGVGAAACTYFSRPLSELSGAQILLLAVIPKAPGLYDPFASEQTRAALQSRASTLAPFVDLSPDQIEAAMSTFRKGTPAFRAPHFVRYALAGLNNELDDRWKQLEPVSITTTLDLTLNEEVQRCIREHLAALAAEAGRGKGVAAEAPLQNASALVLDNRTGQVLAWIGSQGFFDEAHGGQLDGVLLESSSGSTLKPFLYAEALESGYTASSLLPDLPLTFGIGEGYRPENFDRRSRGPVRLRTALASSLNVPAVYLLSRLGLQPFLSTCRGLGFQLSRGAGAGLGAAVGNLEVSLLELTRAFSVFPNGGRLRDIDMFVEAVTTDGIRISLRGLEESRQVFREETAWLIAHILSDPAARASGFGTDSRFNTSFPAIFKSGTASEYTSLWCLGALPAYTIGVWAGNFDGRSAYGMTGSSLPASVAIEVLEQLNRTEGPDSFLLDPPAGLSRARICTASGYRASPRCPATRMEYYLEGTEPRETCPVHGRGISMERLLPEILLDEQRRPSILFPRNDMVFYRDDEATADRQTIEAWIVFDPSDPPEVRLNGRVLPASDPSRPFLPVEPGRYRLEVRGALGSDAASYTIR